MLGFSALAQGFGNQIVYPNNLLPVCTYGKEVEKECWQAVAAEMFFGFAAMETWRN